MKRIIIKVGTSVITEDNGKICSERTEGLARGILSARSRGIEVALVSSGAIAAGMERLGLQERPTDIDMLQAVAAVGQGMLVHMYSNLFSAGGQVAAQVLLTRHDLSHRTQYLNARNTLEKLFGMGIIPVINENDTVATEEITFGENDLLAALVAGLVSADTLILLTDIEGLYSADPRVSQDAVLIERVERITPEIEAMAGERGSNLSSGGMASKLQAARIAVSTGAETFIACGREPGIIEQIIDGKGKGTVFPATRNLPARKRWLGYALRSYGQLAVDRGAAKALLTRTKSLLPAGVVSVQGDFRRGDCVEILDHRGRLIGRGISCYSAGEAERIKGLRSDQVEEVLGEKGEEIINRDEMLIYDRHRDEDKDGS